MFSFNIAVVDKTLTGPLIKSVPTKRGHDNMDENHPEDKDDSSTHKKRTIVAQYILEEFIRWLGPGIPDYRWSPEIYIAVCTRFKR